MISLEIKDYCHTCSDFEPDVEKPQNFYVGSEIYTTIGDTIIKCKDRERCEQLKQYLERKCL